MLTRLAINPNYADLVRAHQLDDFEAVMSSNIGQVVGGHRRRNVFRLELTHGDRALSFFLKREFATQFKDVVAPLMGGRGFVTKARREWEVISALQSEGVPCPEPVIFAQRVHWSLQGYLILTELPGLPLAHWMQQARWTADRQFRREILGSVADAVARLHGLGFDHPDLYSKHVWVSGQADSRRVYLIDFQRTRRYRRLPIQCRWRDLAALIATIDNRWASNSDRFFFLRRYLKSAGLVGLDRQAAEAILPREEHLKSRRKVRELRHAERSGDWDDRLVRVDGGQMWIDRAYQSTLHKAGLAKFDEMMRCSSGTLLRTLPDRQNWRLVLRNGSSEDSTVAYLKRHRVGGLGTWLRSRLERGESVSAGCQEARNVMLLRRGGIASMEVIAFGERVQRWGSVESFLLTEQISDALPLDDFLRKRFLQASKRCGAADSREARRQLDGLIDAVADLAKHFHALGYNHRDFYCCHFLVKEPAPGRFQIHLIDLQRMQYRQRLRGRWIVKDLAQLSYSAPPAVIRAADRVRFLKRYLGVRRLGRRDKRLARRILAKHSRIARRGIAP